MIFPSCQTDFHQDAQSVAQKKTVVLFVIDVLDTAIHCKFLQDYRVKLDNDRKI